MSGYFSRLLHHTGVNFYSRGRERLAALPPIEENKRRLVELTSTSEPPNGVEQTTPHEVHTDEVLGSSHQPSSHVVDTNSTTVGNHQQIDTQQSTPLDVEQRVELPSPSVRASPTSDPEQETSKALSTDRSPVEESVGRQNLTVVEPDEPLMPYEQQVTQYASPAMGERPMPASLEQETLHHVPSQSAAQRPDEVRGRQVETPEDVGVRRTQVWGQVYEGVRHWLASGPDHSEAELAEIDDRVTLDRARSVVQEPPSERSVLVSEHQELQLSIGNIQVSLEAPAEESRPATEPRAETREPGAGRSRLRRHYLRMH